MSGHKIKLELPTLLSELATPVARKAGETLASLFEVIFGGINYYADKKDLIRAKDLKAFAYSIQDKIEKIPPENITEPSLSIIGPTLESSKYYFEEEDLRELFANLIASSVDDRKNSFVHPSFPQIIQNMSNKDAQFLKYVSNNNLLTFPICSIVFQKQEAENYCEFFPFQAENIVILRYLVDFDLFQNPLYDYSSIIDNLIRLKIFDNNPDAHLKENSLYSNFISHPLFIHHASKYNFNHKLTKNNFLVSLQREYISTSSYGMKFISACI